MFYLKFNTLIIKQLLFFLAISCMLASMIMTTCFILMDVSPTTLQTKLQINSIDCWLLIAKIILGCSVTIVQGAVLVALRRSNEIWYHWTHFAYVITWLISLTLSVYITILTLHAGLEQGALNAKKTSTIFQNLKQRREITIETLKEKQKQQKQMFASKWWSKGNDWYSKDIKNLEHKLEQIDNKIEHFNNKKQEDTVSGKSTYTKLASDMQIILKWHISQDRLALLLKYFYLITLSLSLDLGGGLLMMFSIGTENIFKNSEQKKQVNTDILTNKTINFAKADSEEIRLMLPTVPMLLDVLNTWKTRLFFYGGSGSGKTTAIIAYLNKLSTKMVRTNTQLFIIDPKPQGENPWPKWAKAIIGQGYDIKAIKTFLEWIKKDLVPARSAMSITERNKEPDVVILIDELFQLTQDFKKEFNENFADYWVYFLTYTRTLKIYLIASTQSDRVESMGIQGMGDVKNGFTAKMHFVREDLIKKPFHYVIIERPKQRDRLFRPVPVSNIKNFPIRSFGAKIAGVTKKVTNKMQSFGDRVTKSGDHPIKSDKDFITETPLGDKNGDKVYHPHKPEVYGVTKDDNNQSDTAVTLSDNKKPENGTEKGDSASIVGNTESPMSLSDKEDKLGLLKLPDTKNFRYLNDSDKQREILKAYMSLGKKGTPTGAIMRVFGNKNKTMVNEAKILINTFNNNGNDPNG
jgi:DNA replication protein DnaC